MRATGILRFFLHEAALNLRRGWKIAAMATGTIGVSLAVGGLLGLFTANLASTVADWRSEARLVAYLEPHGGSKSAAELTGALEALPGVLGTELVSSAAAEQRFREAFPDLASVVEPGEEGRLPTSVELTLDPVLSAAAAEDLQGRVESMSGVLLVDDDGDWLHQLERVVSILRWIGLGLGGLLIVAAVFTIASVIRLTAYQYRQEIEVMRLVGATEFMIRGPFVMEGLLQGMIGAVAAVGAIAAARWATTQWAPSLVGEVLAGRFLTWGQAALLVVVGGLAGSLGALLSIRRALPSPE